MTAPERALDTVTLERDGHVLVIGLTGQTSAIRSTSRWSPT
jgi:hypothetical protein